MAEADEKWTLCSLFHNFEKEKIARDVMSDDGDKKPPARKNKDSSAKDEQGKCKVFCARCMIIRNISRPHSTDCVHYEQYKATREECNELPLALGICQFCLPFGRHDQEASEASLPVDSQLTLEAEAEVDSNMQHGGEEILAGWPLYSQQEQAEYLASLGPYSRLMAQARISEETAREASWDPEMERTDSSKKRARRTKK